MVILIIMGLVLLFCPLNLAYAALSGSLTPEAIDARTTPVAKVDVSGAAAAAPAEAKTLDVGTSVYEKNCKMCHGTGLAGAPKFGNKSDWAPHIAKGIDTLHDHVIHGFNAMPARGGCSTCSDDDLFKALQHMLDAVK